MSGGAGGPAAPGERRQLLGVPIDDVDMAAALERIAAFVEAGRSDGTTHQVATVNTDFVVNALHDDGLAAVLRRTSLAVPDGMPVVWAARVLGRPVRERVSGVDLVRELAPVAAERGWRLALFGGSGDTAARTAERLATEAPGLVVLSHAAGAVSADGEAGQDDLDWLRAARADVVCVGLGNPKQEWFIDRHRADLGAPVLIGVGGTFDLLAGDKRRAPAWMQRAGLEWAFRAVQEPRRLVKRYAHDAVVFAPAVASAWWHERRTRRRGGD